MLAMRFIIPEAAPSGRVLMRCDRTYCGQAQDRWIWCRHRDDAIRFIRKYAGIWRQYVEKRTENCFFVWNNYTRAQIERMTPEEQRKIFWHRCKRRKK